MLGGAGRPRRERHTHARVHAPLPPSSVFSFLVSRHLGAAAVGVACGSAVRVIINGACRHGYSIPVNVRTTFQLRPNQDGTDVAKPRRISNSAVSIWVARRQRPLLTRAGWCWTGSGCSERGSPGPEQDVGVSGSIWGVCRVDGGESLGSSADLRPSWVGL